MVPGADGRVTTSLHTQVFVSRCLHHVLMLVNLPIWQHMQLALTCTTPSHYHECWRPAPRTVIPLKPNDGKFWFLFLILFLSLQILALVPDIIEGARAVRTAIQNEAVATPAPAPACPDHARVQPAARARRRRAPDLSSGLGVRAAG